MRYIAKGSQPEQLIAWKAENRKAINYNYTELPGPIKQATKRALFLEQGWLCGYTGIRLTEQSSHIEHFKPQHLCVATGEDLEYGNLLAAYPGKNHAGDANLGFGAPFKAENFDETFLISPWSENCEKRFKFNLDGHVAATNPEDAAGTRTIAILGLDHKNLVRLRKAAIDGFIADPRHKRSVAELERLLAGLDRPDSGGQLREFCFALKQALTSLIAKAERYRQHRAFARRQPPR